MDGQSWRGLDCIWVNLKNACPPFFKFTVCQFNTCIKIPFTQLENHPQLLCGYDFANEKLLVFQFDV